MKRYYLAMVVLAVIAAAAAVAGSIAGKPAVSDRVITQDLQQIHERVISYYQTNQRLPAALSDMQFEASVAGRLARYEYSKTPGKTQPIVRSSPSDGARPVSSASFTLCATFATDTSRPQIAIYPAPFEPENHGRGRQCFTDTVGADPQPL